MDLGSRIREMRRARGFSQERLGHEAGVTMATIQRVESGFIRDPHYSTLSGIARTLGTTVAELVGEEPVDVGKAPAPQSGQPEDKAPSRSAAPPSVSWARLQEHFENVRPDEVEYINEMLSEFWRLALPDEKPRAHFVPEDVDGQRVWMMVQQALKEGNVFAPEETQRLTQGAIKRAVLAGQAG